MFASVLPQDTQQALATVVHLDIIQKSYLAGGSALALQFGHRESLDLDFFTQEEFEASILTQLLEQKLPSFKRTRLAWRTILGEIGTVKFSLFYYQYPLLKPTLPFNNIALASPEDIAAMKIAAIGDRGMKRDFIDLYVLMKKFSLQEIFNFYNQKYHNLDDLFPHLLRSLVYFKEAEDDKTVKLLTPIDWNDVKQTIVASVLQYRKTLIG